MSTASRELNYPAQLPITQRRAEIVTALRDHRVLVVAGETGSGKSTQLPKLCLEAGRGVSGLIGHTQPRRLAARTIAERIAEEMGTALGGEVGYAVRFTDRVGPDTRIKVMTDGILLAEVQRDRMLRRYDTIVVDEAHERSLNIDFLLGYLHRLLERRDDLHVVITSATIDTARFAEHFGDAPVIEVSGRTYPVEVRYRPFGADPDDDRDQVAAIADAVEELRGVGSGDVLVFLSGEREIHDAADHLRRLDLPGTEVLPLYARLSAAEQHRIFQPHRGRRIVLATNVAETSLTVPGVRFVVDAGTARISRYSTRLKVQRLPIEPVSQASANQRAGRCGRVAPGTCIRLYDEEDFAARPEFTEPEILRTNLSAVILQMTALGLGDVAAFPFIDPPDARAIRDGVLLLEELGALEPGLAPDRRRLTKLGRRLARLPVDPRLGRMVLAAEQLGCAREVMVVAAALSIQDPREWPADKRQAADEAHARFTAPAGGRGDDRVPAGDRGDDRADASDFMALVRLWNHLREQQRALSSSAFRRLCRNEFLNFLRVREWQDVFSQLRQAAGTVGIHPSTTAAHPDRIHQALLAGLLSQIGMRDGEAREYRGARGARFLIGRESAAAKKLPRWVMAGGLVETNRLWARTVAPIQPEWAERAGAHLVSRSYGEPVWDAQRGAAVTTERVTLFGLPIVSRRVGYDRVDLAAAREMFIRRALVAGEWTTHHPFVAANLAVIAEAEALAERSRRAALVDEATLFAFFDARVPADVVSTRHFDRWWKQARRATPDLLTLTPGDLTVGSGALDPHEFPTEWHQGDLALAVTYRFEPGAPGDGATVHIPVAVLNRVTGDGFDWGVPGFRDEMVESLVRTMPKHLRRAFSPLAETAATVLPAVRRRAGSGSLADALAEALTDLGRATVRPADLDPSRAPAHLRLTFAVDDERGRTLAAGHDLDELRRRLSGRAREAVAATAAGIERTGITTWDVGDLPRTVESARDGVTVVGYPALLDDTDSVSLRVFTNADVQSRAQRTGVRRLLSLAVPVSPSALVTGRTAPTRAPNRAAGASHPGPRPVSGGRWTSVGLGDLRAAVGDVGEPPPPPSPPVPRGTGAELDAAAQLALVRAGVAPDDLAADCIAAATGALVGEHGEVWTAAAFDVLVDDGRRRLAGLAADALVVAARVVASATTVRGVLDRLVIDELRPSVDDMRAQLDRLVRPGFVAATGLSRLADVERYVEAIARRAAKLPEDPRRDRQRMAEVVALEDRYRTILARQPRGRVPAEVVDAGWLLEELRVGTFAQQIRTARPVSPQRVAKALAALG
ncbi:MAG: ATP-dependent RNA helicase HrpA [Ilumatobacteraceae bacterium]